MTSKADIFVERLFAEGAHSVAGRRGERPALTVSGVTEHFIRLSRSGRAEQRVAVAIKTAQEGVVKLAMVREIAIGTAEDGEPLVLVVLDEGREIQHG